MKAVAIALVAAFALTDRRQPAAVGSAVREVFRRGNTGRCRGDGGAVRAVRSRVRSTSASRKGRTYLDEKRGEYSLRWKSKSGPYFNNVVEVPADYDPAQKWQLRVQLHGGVGRPSPNAQAPGRQATATGRAPNRIEGEKQIYLHPSGWIAAQWWDEEQVDNILRSRRCAEAQIQHRRVEGLRHRHFRRRHRRLLHGAEGAEPVVVVFASQRQPRGAS